MKFKRITSAILVITALLSALVITAAAQETSSRVISTEIEILPNGDSIETELITYTELGGAKATKSGQKTKSYKNSSGAVMWSVTVYGTFSYTGSSATCTSASRSTTCPGSGWTIVSSSASKSGNTATAKATAGYNNSNFSLTVSLKCSANGTLS